MKIDILSILAFMKMKQEAQINGPNLKLLIHSRLMGLEAQIININSPNNKEFS